MISIRMVHGNDKKATPIGLVSGEAQRQEIQRRWLVRWYLRAAQQVRLLSVVQGKFAPQSCKTKLTIVNIYRVRHSRDQTCFNMEITSLKRILFS
jgi:hypothetical protein